MASCRASSRPIEKRASSATSCGRVASQTPGSIPADSGPSCDRRHVRRALCSGCPSSATAPALSGWPPPVTSPKNGSSPFSVGDRAGAHLTRLWLQRTRFRSCDRRRLRGVRPSSAAAQLAIHLRVAGAPSCRSQVLPAPRVKCRSGHPHPRFGPSNFCTVHQSRTALYSTPHNQMWRNLRSRTGSVARVMTELMPRVRVANRARRKQQRHPV